jgi:UDP-N-acetylmuramoyl-tripeptide--D-alanyl-D-alanine ligase
MKKFLWNNETLKKACSSAKLHGTCHGNRISINSKEIEEGDIFIAFKGKNVDGHNYVADAIAKGATCAIVEHKPQGLESSEHLMIVPNIKLALTELAIFNRERSKAKILGITGSVGKTSTKEALFIACSSTGKAYCSRKNFNNDLGLPISLASMPFDTEYGVFELGMNHKGEIAELTKILKPHLALITRIAKVHIEYFKSLEDIARAKGEIFLGMDKNGIAILNGDDKYYSVLAELAMKQNIKNICRFGSETSNDSYLIKYEPLHGKPNKIRASICGTEINYKIKAMGTHQALNSLAVLSAIAKLGINLKPAADALSHFTSIAGRGEVVELKIGPKTILIIDDSYNANPTSISAALQVMKDLDSDKYKRKVAVLGDMVEQGTQTEFVHRELLAPFEASNINKLITVGPLMQNLFDAVAEDKRLKHFPDYKNATEDILKLIEDGDCILFKGSNGTKIFEIVKHLKKQTT